LVTTLAPNHTTHIEVGDSTQLLVKGSSIVSLDGGCLHDVLFVPKILTNLLSIYHIFDSGSGKTVEFSPHDVVIRNLHDLDVVLATGNVDFASQLYIFDGFESSNSSGSSIIAHADLVSKLWHEHLGHVNYIYLQQMSSQALVIGLP